VTTHGDEGLQEKKAARADLISPPLEDRRHAAQPHGDHVVDGDDQLPFVLPHGPWRPPNLNHRGQHGLFCVFPATSFVQMAAATLTRGANHNSTGLRVSTLVSPHLMYCNGASANGVMRRNWHNYLQRLCSVWHGMKQATRVPT
jgi:hypothetical protein